MDIVALRKDRPPEVSGSGPILRLKFYAIRAGNTEIELSTGNILRDVGNRDIGLVGRYKSRVTIK